MNKRKLLIVSGKTVWKYHENGTAELVVHYWVGEVRQYDQHLAEVWRYKHLWRFSVVHPDKGVLLEGKAPTKAQARNRVESILHTGRLLKEWIWL